MLRQKFLVYNDFDFGAGLHNCIDQLDNKKYAGKNIGQI